MDQDIGKFLISLLIIVFILILYFSAGVCVLYGCKIGQANILPTDEKCMPYENNTPSVQPIQINIFDTNSKIHHYHKKSHFLMRKIIKVQF